MSNEQLIENLNKDLSLEFQSIQQYVHHIACLKGPEYQQTLKELSGHLSQEIEHALIVAKQIDFLGGPLDGTGIRFNGDPRAALERDLALEETQLDRYRERVEEAARVGLPDVAEALAPILQETQDHIRELRTALDQPARADH